MSPLQTLLQTLRTTAKSPREAGTYFETLTTHFLKHEPFYQNLYRSVLPYATWATQNNLDG